MTEQKETSCTSIDVVDVRTNEQAYHIASERLKKGGIIVFACAGVYGLGFLFEEDAAGIYKVAQIKQSLAEKFSPPGLQKREQRNYRTKPGIALMTADKKERAIDWQVMSDNFPGIPEQGLRTLIREFNERVLCHCVFPYKKESFIFPEVSDEKGPTIATMNVASYPPLEKLIQTVANTDERIFMGTSFCPNNLPAASTSKDVVNYLQGIDPECVRGLLVFADSFFDNEVVAGMWGGIGRSQTMVTFQSGTSNTLLVLRRGSTEPRVISQYFDSSASEIKVEVPSCLRQRGLDLYDDIGHYKYPHLPSPIQHMALMDHLINISRV